MNHWIRFVYKEIVNSKQFSLFFIVNLAIGLIGYVSLTSFHGSVLNHFNQNLKDILTADIMVSSSKPVEESQLKIIEAEIGINKTNANTRIRIDFIYYHSFWIQIYLFQFFLI